MRHKVSRRWCLAAAMLAAAAGGACRGKEASAPAGETGGSTSAADPYAIPETDTRMLAAREMARVSVSGFIEAVRGGNPAHSRFMLRTGSGGRPTWVGDVTYDGHTFKGRATGPPYQAGTTGAEMKLKREDIIDWMYLDGSRMVGGFSVRAIRDSLAADKRKEFESKLPFRIE